MHGYVYIILYIIIYMAKQSKHVIVGLKDDCLGLDPIALALLKLRILKEARGHRKPSPLATDTADYADSCCGPSWHLNGIPTNLCKPIFQVQTATPRTCLGRTC